MENLFIIAQAPAREWWFPYERPAIAKHQAAASGAGRT